MDLARNLNATHPPQGLMEYYASALKSLQQNQLTNEVMARLLPGSDDQENARKAQAEYFQQQLLISQQQQILLAQQYQQLLMAAAAASSLQQRLNNMDQDRNPNLLPASNQLQLWKQLLPGVPAGSEGSEDSGGPRNTPSVRFRMEALQQFSLFLWNSRSLTHFFPDTQRSDEIPHVLVRHLRRFRHRRHCHPRHACSQVASQ